MLSPTPAHQLGEWSGRKHVRVYRRVLQLKLDPAGLCAPPSKEPTAEGNNPTSCAVHAGRALHRPPAWCMRPITRSAKDSVNCLNRTRQQAPQRCRHRLEPKHCHLRCSIWILRISVVRTDPILLILRGRCPFFRLPPFAYGGTYKKHCSATID
jgi:hypothetical protein